MAVKSSHKHAVVVAIAVYLVMSFMPQIGLMNLIGKKPPMAGGPC